MNNPLKALPIYRYRKINKNNQLCGLLKYQAIVSNNKMYFKMRSWCLRKFGETVEYGYYRHYRDYLGYDPVWSWDTDADQSWKGHIYLKDDSELAMFDAMFQELAVQHLKESP